VTTRPPDVGSEAWLRRYARQVVLAGVGEEGQRRLGNASARIAGDGPALVAAAVHLAAAGVGRLVLDAPAPLSARAAASWPFAPSDAGSPTDAALARLLRSTARAGDVVAGGAAGSVDVVVACPGARAGTTAAAGTPVVVVEGEAGGGVRVRAGRGPAAPPAAVALADDEPALLAAAALAADAALRILVGQAPPAAALVARRDGSVTSAV
jgi:hypothetical protein